MKNYVFGLAALALIVPLSAAAMEYRLSENPSTNAQETIVEDLYMAGGNVTSAGAVEGDLYTAGGSVAISGPVSADVVAAGGNVSLIAPVGDDVRVAGGNLLIQSSVGGDLLAAGGQVTVGGEGVAGDASLAGGMVRLDAPVSGDLRVGGENVFLNSAIAGDVEVHAETLILGSQANISGNLSYQATSELTAEAGSVVAGETTYEAWEGSGPLDRGDAAAFISVAVLVQFLTLLVSALVIGLTFRKYSQTIVQKATTRPLPHLGIGLVVLIVLPILSILVMFTVVGVPLGILGLISFVALMLITWFIAPIIVGSYVSDYVFKTGTAVTWKTILMGVAIYTILGFIPILGWLVQLALFLLALGSLTSLKWDVAKQWR